MQSSDILISKASGITVFEALYAEIPLYIINLFLLQEISNARYIAKR